MRHRLRGQGRSLIPRKRVRLTVASSEAGRSLEELFTTRGGLTKDEFRRALEAGGVEVGRHRARRADAPVERGEVVVAHFAEHGREAVPARALDRERVLFVDDELVAVDKPPGISAQAIVSNVAAGLDEAVRALLGGFVGLVHRLDLETSGVTIFGRTPGATTFLSDQFRDGKIEKRYRAIVAGVPEWTTREVDGPIGLKAGGHGTFAVTSNGKPAKTELTRIAKFDGQGIRASVVDARPRTGRTHQIRVHATSLGHPLLGDRRYGGALLLTSSAGGRLLVPRVCLHACELTFEHPSRGRLTVAAPWPADLADVERSLAELSGATRESP